MNNFGSFEQHTDPLHYKIFPAKKKKKKKMMKSENYFLTILTGLICMIMYYGGL